MLNSRTVKDDLIARFDLRKVYSEKLFEDAQKSLDKRTTIAEDKKSGIITISVQDRDPHRAVQLANAYIHELNSRLSDLSTSSAHRERIFLEGRLASIKKELDQSSLEVSEFSSRNKTLDPQVQGKATLEAASALQGQLIAAETELSGLTQIYGPQNSRVRAASARVNELNRKLRRLSGEGNRAEVGGPSQPAEPYPSLEQLPILGNTYYQLYRANRINETIYELLMRDYELAKVEEAKETPSIKVLDEPVLPEQKAWPPRTLPYTPLGNMYSLRARYRVYLGSPKLDTPPEDHPYRIALGQLKRATRSSQS